MILLSLKTSVKMRCNSDESDTNQVSDLSETFLDPFTILKEVCKKKF